MNKGFKRSWSSLNENVMNLLKITSKKETEAMNESSPAPEGASKLSTIFLIVLGLHVVVIVVVSAYQLLKGDSSGEAEGKVPQSVALVEGMDTRTMGNENAAAEPIESVVEAPQSLATEDGRGRLTGTERALQSVGTGDARMPVRRTTPELDERAWESASSGIAQENVPWPVPTQPEASQVVKEVRVKERIAVGAIDAYEVKKGDSLIRIAKRHGISVKVLKDLNSLNGDLIKIGQKLQVPASVSERKEKTASVAWSGNYKIYEVGKGDTLWRIARNFGTKPKVIQEMNGIKDPRRLKVGMKIKVPELGAKEDTASEAASLRRRIEESPSKKPFRDPGLSSEMALLREAYVD